MHLLSLKIRSIFTQILKLTSSSFGSFFCFANLPRGWKIGLARDFKIKKSLLRLNVTAVLIYFLSLKIELIETLIHIKKAKL